MLMAEARDIAARWLQAFNAHDESAARALNASNIRFQAPGGVRLEGRDAVASYNEAWLNGFPDAWMTVENELVSGPWVVQECIFEGTHTGPFEGPAGAIPATGRKVAGKCVQIGRYENGLATDVRLYYDQMELITQLGLMPEPAAAATS
jgi:predicted ester cyclase